MGPDSASCCLIVVIPDAFTIHNTCRGIPEGIGLDEGEVMDEHRANRGADEGSGPPRRAKTPAMDRRTWLRVAAGSVAALGGLDAVHRATRADEDSREADEAEALRRAEARARKVTTRPLVMLKSAHYQAIGDASEPFIRLTLADCEEMAADFLHHFRSRGFDVKLPDRRMTVIVFRDERPFLKLAEKTPPGTMGFYSLSANWLALFDFRNVPMNPHGPGQTNMETLTHEATHQLTFNTGLLARQSDIPLSIIEGLAMYCERRRLFGRNEPGQPNLRRLDELAHIRRREPWIGVAELLVDDRACFRRSGDRLLLSYSESWLLVYHLMNDRARLPQFRAYLEVLRTRTDNTRRLEDARAHFGDLARLDGELRQEAVRLQQAL
jgi:hypothetical protein